MGGPSQVAQLGVSSPCAKVAGFVLCQGTYKKQLMKA